VSLHVKPEDSNLSSVEAMQWVLLCLSIGHDVTENISHSTEHRHARTTFMLTASGTFFSSFGRSCDRKSL
jgi:hypothetical protein